MKIEEVKTVKMVEVEGGAVLDVRDKNENGFYTVGPVKFTAEQIDWLNTSFILSLERFTKK